MMDDKVVVVEFVFIVEFVVVDGIPRVVFGEDDDDGVSGVIIGLWDEFPVVRLGEEDIVDEISTAGLFEVVSTQTVRFSLKEFSFSKKF